MAVILQGAGLLVANVGVFLWSVPVGFVTLGLTGVLIGVTLERIDVG